MPPRDPHNPHIFRDLTVEVTVPPPRTEMRCRRCGGFSSAQTCWPCTEGMNPVPAPAPFEFPSPPPAYEPPAPDDAIAAFLDLLQLIERLKDGAEPFDEFETLVAQALEANGQRKPKTDDEERSRFTRMLEDDDLV